MIESKSCSGSSHVRAIPALKKKVCKIVGGVGSPLLANLLLDGLDKELERREPRFVRYADDCNIDVKSARAGPRVLARVTRVLTRRLKLTVNAAKSAVDRPWRRTYKQEIRRLTYRTRGVSVRQVVREVRRYVTGWYAYFGLVEVPSRFKELDSGL